MHAIFLESNQKLSHTQYHVPQGVSNNITFNESHLPLTQQMDKLYMYLKQEINEAQLSDIAEKFLAPASALGILAEDAQQRPKNLTAKHDELLVPLQHSSLVQDSS